VEGRFGMTRGLEKRFTRLVAISSPLFFEFSFAAHLFNAKITQIFGFLYPFGVVLTTDKITWLMTKMPPLIYLFLFIPNTDKLFWSISD
jgi:hypothetical protein